MSRAVLDASAGVELALNTVSGRRLARSIGGRDPWVPEVFYSEVAGVLRRMQLHGAVTARRAEVAVTGDQRLSRAPAAAFGARRQQVITA